MKYKFLILSVFLSLLTSTNLFSQVIPIDSVHKLDVNGVPLLVGQTVTVRGVVTTNKEFGTSIVYFQDATAGLAAYDVTFCNAVTRGDSVQVTGVVVNYNGLIELQPVNSFQVLAQNKTVYPLLVTPLAIRDSGEVYESRLIRINGNTAVKTLSGNPVTAWTVSGSGVNYRIFVGTDSCEIRIYGSSNIANTAVPPFPFAVVAVSSQFKSAAPYFGGYQILPRDLSDLISTTSGPVIAATPVESNITQTGITLTFNTLSPGDTKVKYFVSDSIGQPLVYSDSVFNASLVTSHTVNLTNLKPGMIYYALVSSTNGTGTSTVSKYFATASHSTSRGIYELYFNYSIDSNYAIPGNKAKGNQDFKIRLGQRIDSCTKSIDMAIYSFDDLTYIYDKLINAFIRGVKIRVVYDYRTGTPQPLMQQLINAGIKVQIRPDPGTTGYIMHNKFLIFDSRDTSSYSDDWLWAGSTNITSEQFTKDVNHVVLIQDETLSRIYTREFEEMWGSHNDNNNSANAKFGSAKTDNTPHILNINNKRVECYFSPSDDLSLKLENLITNYTNKSINFGILSFTRFNISNKMKAKYNPPSVMVRGVFDYSGTQNSQSNGVWLEMKGIGGTYPWNPPAKVYAHIPSLYSGGQFHHKYLILDADSLSSNPVTWTGSFNFTNNGQFGNDENALIIFDSLITNQFYQEFVKRLSESGGSVGVERLTSDIPDSYSLSQNYPNPFNPETKISFSIRKQGFVNLKVYDILGKEVKVLISQELNAGSYFVNFNASSLSTGVYLYKLDVNGYSEVHKMMLLK